MHRQMRHQMHSDTDVELADAGPGVKPPTEPWLRAVYDAELDAESWYQTTSRIVESGCSLCHLIDCPAVAATATAILSGYFVPAVSTNCPVSAVLDLYRC